MIRDVNLSGLDLNLLPQLGALLRRCNVTRAAEEVGLSQPAMSRALARLRAEFDDALLARGRDGLVLTPRAAELLPRVEAALADLKALFREPQFDAATAERTIRIAAADTQTVLLVPALMARLAEAAPGVSLRVESYGPDLLQRMDKGVVDLAFALATTPLPPGTVSESIAEDRLALVMRRNHPAADRDWTLADYARYDHVGVAIIGDGSSELDAILAASGLRRRIALVTPHFTAAVAAVAATDLVTTISATFAERLAEPFGLVLKSPPLPDARLPMTLVWSHLRDRDPVLKWFRGLVGRVAAGVYPGPTSSGR
ncbi:MAG: LysR family transcriptional regulator [Ancalomicrobiaceae bacterium]|nr:LysR family transcriptional regulator [Ancalomicrobiaceae bacterium]